MFFYMESAISLINLNDIIKTALSLSAEKYHGRFNLEGFVFGSDDFCADIGASRTKDSVEVTYARQKLVTYCKAYKLKAIDMVYIDFKDLEGLKMQCEQEARMGFTGKQVIHPGQVDVCQNAFTPSQEKIEWATGLVEAFEHHQKSGAGAFTHKGQMIDMPSLLQAKNILKIIEKVKKI
ncbi:citrate lyase subunit beta mitochondrial [Brachionus plicatilis]|uniref:Citrate lyase subunit beta mitochondrial n=1 Tax=Brachionus plicatilis TaxID=10195 RepID=A0A3M7SYK5_BRAPC|nr:citrate lyase subunit beta mitochondrial [Brachionus plicatilis]